MGYLERLSKDRRTLHGRPASAVPPFATSRRTENPPSPLTDVNEIYGVGRFRPNFAICWRASWTFLLGIRKQTSCLMPCVEKRFSGSLPGITRRKPMSTTSIAVCMLVLVVGASLFCSVWCGADRTVDFLKSLGAAVSASTVLAKAVKELLSQFDHH